MIVVCDTSPLNYLVIIGAERLLPEIFGRVCAPPAVLAELQNMKTPIEVQQWAASLPAWLEIVAPSNFIALARLGPGESEAIALAKELNADIILIDERDGTSVAKQLGLTVTGTLGVLGLAAEKGLVSLPDVFAKLRKTTMRLPDKLIAEMLRRDELRTRPSDPA